MKRFFADVRFNTLEFEASNEEEAEVMLNEMLDQIGAVDTVISWDNVDWTIYKEDN